MNAPPRAADERPPLAPHRVRAPRLGSGARALSRSRAAGSALSRLLAAAAARRPALARRPAVTVGPAGTGRGRRDAPAARLGLLAALTLVPTLALLLFHDFSLSRWRHLSRLRDADASAEKALQPSFRDVLGSAWATDTPCGRGKCARAARGQVTSTAPRVGASSPPATYGRRVRARAAVAHRPSKLTTWRSPSGLRLRAWRSRDC